MSSRDRKRISTTESPWVRRTLVGVALVFLFVFLVLPLAAVFTEALRKGLDAYLEGLREPDAWSAIKLTLLAAAISVPLNLVFGVAAAWCIAKFDFRGTRRRPERPYEIWSMTDRSTKVYTDIYFDIVGDRKLCQRH